jgi:hypothetical protein
MRGEDRAPALASIDKLVINALKQADWDAVASLLAQLRQALLDAAPSRAGRNWSPPAQPLGLNATLAEKRLGWAVAEGYGGDGWMADIPAAEGLLGERPGRSVDLARIGDDGLAFFAFKVNPSGEDIFKALRDLLLATALYRAFLQAPRQFGYNTERSPLALDDPAIRWELVAPKDMINPRKSEMRWGEKDVWGMQALMKPLGVSSFSLGRLQAEAEALQANISRENFSGPRARQWFENRVTVLIA